MSGCGESDEDKVRKVVTSAAKNGAAFCDHATDRLLVREYGSQDACRKDEADDSGVSTNVRDVKVNNGRAVARTEANGEGRDGLTYVLRREDGDWRIDRVGR